MLFSFLSIFPLTMKALLRMKRQSKVKKEYAFTKQAEARKTYMELMSYHSYKDNVTPI